jgi:2-oxoglutarate ferredoxin oxidoreductase subunit delta
LAKVTFSKELCKGCGLCVTACPKKILSISKTESNNSGYFICECTDMGACIGCTSCALMCPDSVIEVER